MSRVMSFLKRKVPIWVFVCVIIALASSVCLILSIIFSPVADWFNSTVCFCVRQLLAYLSFLLPFSLFELLLILLVPLIVLFCIFVIGRAGYLRTALSLVGGIAVIFTLYVLTLGIGYHTTPMADRLSIRQVSTVERDELYRVGVILREEVNTLAEELQFRDGESRMGYTVAELSRRLLVAYDAVSEQYSYPQDFIGYVKPVLFSCVMSDAGITGIYSFFTGEANVNVDYPDYSLPFTCAHEMAHQRGVSRENEANFLAFLVCINSDDPYIRYSGYLNMYEYVASALYRTDKDAYSLLLSGLSEGALADVRAASAVTAAHRDSWFNKLNDFLNDTYLKVNGTEGTVSYGYVVKLVLGYYSNEAE